MELIVAILIALGALTNSADFNAEYKVRHEAEVSKAQSIIDNGQYRIDERTGGVITDPGVGL
ncbi:MAG: hypothetical protein ABI855_06460 [Bacteroidota bacterium]